MPLETAIEVLNTRVPNIYFIVECETFHVLYELFEVAVLYTGVCKEHQLVLCQVINQLVLAQVCFPQVRDFHSHRLPIFIHLVLIDQVFFIHAIVIAYGLSYERT